MVIVDFLFPIIRLRLARMAIKEGLLLNLL